MSSKKSSLYGALKALYVIPLVAVSLIANAETMYDYVAQKPEEVSQQNDTIKIEYRGDTGTPNAVIYIVDGELADGIGDLQPQMIESMSVLKDDSVNEIKEKYNLTGEYDGVINITLKKEDEVLQFVLLDMPTFNGGDENEFSKWANRQIMYPAEAKAAKAEGKIYVSFHVEMDGSVNDVKVLNSIHPAIDAEVVRVVSSSPKWSAAKPDASRPESLKFAIPFIFDIRGVENETECPVKVQEDPRLVEGIYIPVNEVAVVAYL